MFFGMLSGILKEHQQSQLKQKEILEKKKQEAIEASAQLTETLVDHLNVGVAQAYLNERKIDIEARKLQQQSSVFSKNAKDFLKLIEGLNSSLKELGDVETWAKHIESDAKLISAALECAYKAHQETKPSTSEQP